MAGKPRGGKSSSDDYEPTRVYVRRDLKLELEQRQLNAKRERRNSPDLSDTVNESLGMYLLANQVEVPVVGRVSAGVLLVSDELILDRIWLPAAMVRDARFGLQVNGDSMEPTISAGSIVLVRPATDAVHNQIVVLRIDGETAVKRYVQVNGQHVFRSDNPGYPELCPTEAE